MVAGSSPARGATDLPVTFGPYALYLTTKGLAESMVKGRFRSIKKLSKKVDLNDSA